MCGIIGRIGTNNAVSYILDGLSLLEYRGYDSAGIAVIDDDGYLAVRRASGKLSNLRKTIDSDKTSGNSGIGHTRWATHGKPSVINAHPHISPDGLFAVVHNGIIENSKELTDKYIGSENLVSETDTETVAHLLSLFYDGDVIKTVSRVTEKLKGSYALGIICTEKPDVIYCAAKSSPLVVAYGDGGSFIASDVSAVSRYTDSAYSISDGEICAVTADKIYFYDKIGTAINKNPIKIIADENSISKDGYEHYMMREIMQQPDAVRKTLLPFLDNGRIKMSFASIDDVFFKNDIREIVLVACGSAYHAGLVGQYVIEHLAKIPCHAEVASEFRYNNPLIENNTLAIFISQSGETADTLAALRLAKSRGARVISIVNVAGSALAKEGENIILTAAGKEVAVATTKAYSAQLAVLYAFAVYLAALRGTIDGTTEQELVHELSSLPEKIRETIEMTEDISKSLALKFKNATDMYFIGRLLDFAAAMEASLKMKEISYVHSEAYAAGELKHGTISLIENGTPVIALAGQSEILPKTASNICEVKARGAETVIVTDVCHAGTVSADTVISVPDTAEEFAVSLRIIPLQLFAYYSAKERGCDIDKPKNLAKSVTVE